MREPLMLLSDALIRSSVLLLAGLAVLFVLRGRSSALRHWILAATMTAAALAAPIAWVLPDWSIARVSTPAALVFDSPSVPVSAKSPRFVSCWLR